MRRRLGAFSVKSANQSTAPSLIGASAGSGKTFRLTEVVTAAVDPRQAEPVPLEGVVAVTYTQKGAAELASRIRRSFASKGSHELTHRLPLAYIGTVHAVCLRLVKEFAMDAGLSPMVDVVPGGEDRLLRQALEWGLEPAFQGRLDHLAWAFELRLQPQNSRVDWFGPVQDIMTLARSNRIVPEALAAMAERSAGRLLELLGPAESDGDALSAEFLLALRASHESLKSIEDGRKNTGKAKKLVLELLTKAETGGLKWNDWLRAQGVAPAKSAAYAVAALREVATRVDRHPRFQAELRELTFSIYEAARRGLDTYDEWKRRRRIIDYVDMLDRALTLVEHPEVRAELCGRFKLLVVDEFQDTSPVQLALFVRLHELAGSSTWVGDRKQCIFEYAGADPELMEAVTTWARAAGGSVERLPYNRRSRSELVECSNAVFLAALRRHGYTREEICTAPQRPSLPELNALPALGFWALNSGKVEEDAVALAEGVRRLLADPAATPVLDRTMEKIRDVRAGDIAILVATNAEAERLAEALALRGVRAAIARAGLLATPEGVLMTAALRCLLEPGNALSIAQIEALTGFRGLAPDAWLNERLAHENQRRAARAAGEAAPIAEIGACVARLEELRREVQCLAPTEAVDRVLACLDFASLCRRWPDSHQRLANLDALRAMAANYEERSAQNREAATVAGLLRFFDEAAKKILVHDEELASDDQHTTTGPDAVNIVTYHRAKGLEWPVVILGSLSREPRRDSFEVSPESDCATFDPADPLGGRWIRYWPWPFGQLKTSRLKNVAASSAEGLAITAREERERVRLLYVGFTRARDHLILAARSVGEGYETAWLDELQDEAGVPLLRFPPASQMQTPYLDVVVGSGADAIHVPTRCWSLECEAPAAGTSQETTRAWFASGQTPVPPRLPYWIAPSRASTEWPDLELPIPCDSVSTGQRLPLGSSSRTDWDVVGNAVHAFLAADLPELRPAERLLRATRLLSAVDLLGVLAPEALLQAGDNLRTWIDARWPAATWQREVPIAAVVASAAGNRRLAGTIDLLLELPEGVVLIDHKSYPGAPSTWQAKAAEFAPQFAAYGEALRLAGKRVLEQWVSFAIGGGAVRLAAKPCLNK
jgi:ATP-dependent helicase/nuclease subunit A